MKQRHKSTKKFKTHLGDIEAETAECANCGNEMLADDAVSVGVGLRTTKCRGASICDATHNTYSDTRQLCHHCAESVLGYHGVSMYVHQKGPEVTFGVLGAIIFLISFVPVANPMVGSALAMLLGAWLIAAALSMHVRG